MGSTVARNLSRRPSISTAQLYCCLLYTSNTPSGGRFFEVYRFYRHSLFGTPSGGSIFRCTTKDRGERRAKGLRSRPLDSGFLYGGMMPDVRTWYVFALVHFTRFRLVRRRAPVGSALGVPVVFALHGFAGKPSTAFLQQFHCCKHCFRRTLAYCGCILHGTALQVFDALRYAEARG